METHKHNHTTYKFSELTDEAKETAVQELADINVDYDWWNYCYEDAKNVGIEITEFDLERNRHCDGCIYDYEETAYKILKEHGEACETFQTATNYLKERAELVKKYSDGIKTDEVAEDNEYEFDNDCDELDVEFKRSILEDYSIMLQKECDYLQSSESIIETIEANEYDFNEDGTQH